MYLQNRIRFKPVSNSEENVTSKLKLRIFPNPGVGNEQLKSVCNRLSAHFVRLYLHKDSYKNVYLRKRVSIEKVTQHSLRST